jgi:hypothetical protein
MVSYTHAVYVTCVSALGCREVGFNCDTWGKHYSQLILPKNLDQSRQFRRMGLHSGVRSWRVQNGKELKVFLRNL